jgi:CHASE3 domain sensor protein
VQMLDRQRVQQAAADAAKKLVDAAEIAARKLADATKETEETVTAAAVAAALSAPEEAQVSLIGSTATAACCSARMYLTATAACCSVSFCGYVSACRRPSETSES